MSRRPLRIGAFAILIRCIVACSSSCGKAISENGDEWPTPERWRSAARGAPRALRRCFITRAIELGVDSKTISAWHGHQKADGRQPHLRPVKDRGCPPAQLVLSEK